MNTAIPLPDFSETITAKFQLAAYLLKIRFTTCQIRVIHLPLQNILSSTNWNLWWIGCLQLFIRFSQLFIASLISGLYYKLNWAKRASADYWLLGTLLYPWPLHERTFWNFKKCRAVSMEAYPYKQMSEKKFFPNVAPSPGSGPPSFIKQNTRG